MDTDFVGFTTMMKTILAKISSRRAAWRHGIGAERIGFQKVVLLSRSVL